MTHIGETILNKTGTSYSASKLSTTLTNGKIPEK